MKKIGEYPYNGYKYGYGVDIYPVGRVHGSYYPYYSYPTRPIDIPTRDYCFIFIYVFLIIFDIHFIVVEIIVVEDFEFGCLDQHQVIFFIRKDFIISSILLCKSSEYLCWSFYYFSFLVKLYENMLDWTK